MKISKIYIPAFLLLISFKVFATPATVYFNGDILTMEGDKPQYVEAVVVKGEKIAYTGNLKDALNQAGPNPNMHMSAKYHARQNRKHWQYTRGKCKR